MGQIGRWAAFSVCLRQFISMSSKLARVNQARILFLLFLKERKMRFNSTLLSLTLYHFKDFISLKVKHTVCVYLAMHGDN